MPAKPKRKDVIRLFDDPYRVLGLDRNATDEEVKQAYRRLAKKYHPDMNPGDEHAAKMMNDINAAYEQIKNPPQQTAWRNAYDPFSGWQHQQQKTESGPSSIQAARHFIRYGSYDSALNALQGVPSSQRNAEWYYLSAVANTHLGNRVLGLQHIQTAVSMEPDNMLYRQTMEQIRSSGTAYQQTREADFSGGPSMLRTCCYGCILSNLCCGSNFCFSCFPFCV